MKGDFNASGSQQKHKQYKHNSIHTQIYKIFKGT